MAKVIQFPRPNVEKFGFRPVRKNSKPTKRKPGQLDLFSTGKVVSLNQLSRFEEALLLDDRGDAKAKEIYQRAIDEGDSIADSYCNLGILESQNGHYTKAIDCFTKCLKENPRHFEAHYNLANLYAEVGNLSLAKVHYGISIEVEPHFPNSHFNLGLTLAMNKEVEEAIHSLKSYCRLVSVKERVQAEELIQAFSQSLGN
ncbi:MAG: tetratricopeptide repeat protein [Bacteroidetes bacterium]|nr:tetratricopeptide repeat protein [Bacteroidota bacterium]MBI3482245.1 tetratricopeptide repeat protein [Bacteroidota bacterium]